jgi:hypothetical protein
MGYSGVWGEMIHEKNLRSKISSQTPFKKIAKSQQLKIFSSVAILYTDKRLQEIIS